MNIRRAAKTLGITAAVTTGTYFGIGAILCEGVLGRFTLNLRPDTPPKAPETINTEQTNDPKKDADNWFAASAPKDNILITKTGDRIHSYIIPAAKQTHKWAILIHGYTSKPATMAKQGHHFYKMGYNTLFPFLRGHRNDEHRHTSFGYFERYDIIEWIDHITAKDPDAEIVLLGCSMGGATTMLVTGEDLPPNVKCAIADCGFTSAWDEFHEQIGSLLHLPGFPFVNAANTVAKLFLKWDFKDCSPKNAVARSKTPTLFIHGEKDTFVPYRMMDELFENCSAEKDKLSVPDAEHDESCAMHPELYWPQTEEFIAKYIK